MQCLTIHSFSQCKQINQLQSQHCWEPPEKYCKVLNQQKPKKKKKKKRERKRKERFQKRRGKISLGLTHPPVKTDIWVTYDMMRKLPLPQIKGIHGKSLDKPITEARLDKFCLSDAAVLVTVHLDEGFLHHQLLQRLAAAILLCFSWMSLFLQ